MFSVIYKNFLLYVTVAIFVVSLALIMVFGLKFGIDFTGGSLLEVSYTEAPAKSVVEEKVQTLNFGGTSVRETEGTDAEKTGYIIRTKDLTEEERINLETAVLELGSGGSVDRFNSIGPVMGDELTSKAVWAISAVVLIIILYVAYAFAGIGTPVNSWVYGVITIFVLIHDILVPTAMMAVLGYLVGAEIDVLFVMAILAVLGYSVNDTIVIFDRVRENLLANRTVTKTKTTEPGGLVRETVTYTLTKPFSEIVGSAVSQSLARSINTSLTTFIALLALFFIGGTLTQNFALVLMAGVLAGTYSSIFIASPLLLAYAEYKAKRESK